jgi:hypothetical protein
MDAILFLIFAFIPILLKILYFIMSANIGMIRGPGSI